MQNIRRFVVKKGDAARQELLEGVYFGADAVARTLGPAGRNSISGVRGGPPHITNDGVSILRELWIPNEIQMLGLRSARESALKLNEIAGDGTSSAMVLTYNILLAATKKLGYTTIDPASGKYVKGTVIDAPSPMVLKRQIDTEAGKVIDELKKMAQPVASEEELIGATRVAVEDEQLAKMIGEMQWLLGPDGTILVEDSNEPQDSIERINGIRFDNGFPTSRVINNQEKQLLELDNVHVIFTNATIGAITDFSNAGDRTGAGIINVLMANLSHAGKPRRVVIVARKFEQLVMQEIAENFKQGVEIYPINAPYVNQTQVFKDMAATLGGTFMDTEENRSLRTMTMADVGFATKVQASRWNAILAGTNDEAGKNRIDRRVDVLRKEVKGEASEFAKKMLESRIAQLLNGFALMKVGALSEADQKRKRDKVDDAVASARSALQEGLVPGAGNAYKLAGEALGKDSLLLEPLGAIAEQVQHNAGGTLEVADWVKDPLKVVRLVVEKAASIAGNLLTAEIAIDHKNPSERPWIEPETTDAGGADGTNE